LRLGEADLGERDLVGDLDREAERGVNERRGDLECAERGRLWDPVGDRSRIGLGVRVRERAGDGERDAMLELIRTCCRKSSVLTGFLSKMRFVVQTGDVR
jgi:hypothetical protein